MPRGRARDDADHDRLVRAAVSGCGALVQPGPSFTEDKLVAAFCASLRLEQGGASGGPESVPIPDWSPQPGRTDIVVRSAAFDGRLLAEAKVDDVDQMLWDLLKMLSGSQIQDVRAVYLLGAARPVRSPGLAAARWAGRRACAELFDEENDGRVWETRWMLEEWEKAWEDLLAHGTGRPTRVPARVRVRFMGSSTVPAFPSYEARCVEVVVDGDEWLDMEKGRLPSLSSSQGPVFGSDAWIQGVLPQMTDAEAHDAVGRMIDLGMSAAEIPSRVLPFLPRLGNELRGAGRDGRSLTEPPDLWDRVGGMGWPSLSAAVSGCSFLCGASSLGEPTGCEAALITFGGEGVRASLDLPASRPPGAHDVAARLERTAAAQFALVTPRFSDGERGRVHVLMGCPTGRRDVLMTLIHLRDGLLHSTPWAEVDADLPWRFVGEIMSELWS